MTTKTTTGVSGGSRVFVPLGLVFLTVGVSIALVVPFLALFLDTEVGASPLAAGVFLVAGPLAGVLAALWIGRLSDRFPIRRRLLIGAACAGVLGAALMAVVRDYYVLLGLQITAFAIAGSLFPQTFAYAREVLQRHAPERVAMGINSMRMVFSIAWVAGPPLAAFLVQAGGFRLVYGVAAGMYALAAVLTTVILPEIHPEPVDPATPPPAAAAPLSRGMQVLITVTFTALQCPLTLGVQALPLFIRTDLGGQVSDAGLLLAVCAGLEIPLMLLTGWLATRLPARTVIVGGAACGVVYFVIVLLSDSVTPLFPAQLVNALYIAAISGVAITFVQDLMPDRPGQATTLFTNTFPIGAMLAGPLFGLAQRFDYRLAYAMCAGLCVVGLVLLTVMRERRPAVG